MKKLGLLTIGIMGLASLGVACEFHAAVGEPEHPKPPPPKVAPKPAIITPQPKGNAANRGIPPRLKGWNFAGGGVAVKPGTPAAPSAAPMAPTAPTTPPGAPTSAPSAAPMPAAPSGGDSPVAPVIHGSNALGSDQNTPGSWHGVVYFIPQGSTKLPDFTTLKPTASFYTKDINVPTRSFTDGFPGVDARTEWFAVEYYNALNVTKEDDYWFRVVSDDGSKFYIDDTLILDDDGVHTATEKKGAAHLVTGAHTIRLDYFQGPRDQIAVQLFVTPPNAAEKPLEAALP